jgi:protein gp37
MAASSRIEWTQTTWNPVTGCTPISLGCQHCYAQRMAHRLQAMGQERYRNGFEVALHHDLVDAPLRWRHSRLVFVNSMSDLFHERVPVEFIQQVFHTMALCPQHTFQVLTKRSARMAELSRLTPDCPRVHEDYRGPAPASPDLVGGYTGMVGGWPGNVWAGVTVERADYTFRIDHLRQVGAAVRFLSLEPLLGPLPGLNLEGIGWVIVGGESGPGARAMAQDWVLDIRDQCMAANVPFFFKQWGGVHRTKRGRLVQGRIWDQVPQERPHPHPRSGRGLGAVEGA